MFNKYKLFLKRKKANFAHFNRDVRIKLPFKTKSMSKAVNEQASVQHLLNSTSHYENMPMQIY